MIANMSWSLPSQPSSRFFVFRALVWQAASLQVVCNSTFGHQSRSSATVRCPGSIGIRVLAFG